METSNTTGGLRITLRAGSTLLVLLALILSLLPLMPVMQPAFAAGGAYSITFSAADPDLYIPPIPYPPLTAPIGRGNGDTFIPNAYFIDPVTSTAVKVQSLAPEDMALGQIVPFEIEIAVSGSTSPENGQITFTAGWNIDTTSNSDFGYDETLGVIAAFVDTGDGGHLDPGADATVDTFSWTVVGDEIQGTVNVVGLNDGDKVVIEVWLVLEDTIPAGSTGNVSSRLISAQTSEGDTISTGNQTVPLLRVQEFFSADADVSVTKSDSPDPVTAGDQLTYEIVVLNSGPAIANEVSVTDTLDPNTTFVSASASNGGTCTEIGGTVTCDLGSIAVGVENQVTITIVVDVSAGAPTDGTISTGTCSVGDPGVDLCNTVSVTSITNDPTPGNDSDSEPTDVQEPAAPALSIDKTSTTTEVTAAGEVVPYSYLVSNDGNVTLTGVTVTDNNVDDPPGVTCDWGNSSDPATPAGTLSPDETVSCTAQHTVTQAEFDAGGYLTNIATADSDQTDPVTDQVDIPITQTPALSIVKTSTTTQVIAAGEVVPYSYLVSNDGNVTLTGVTVTDNNVDDPPGVTCDWASSSDPATPAGTLSPDETVSCTAQHTVTQAEFDAGGYLTNIATADSDQTDPVTDQVDIPIAEAELTVDKTCTEDVFLCDDIEYQVTVTNTGDLPLVGVVVQDPLIGLDETVDLGAGESRTFTGTYRTCPPPERYTIFLPLVMRGISSPSAQHQPSGRTLARTDQGTVVNTATATGQYGSAVITASDSCTTSVHELAVSKDAQPHVVRTYQWTIAKTVDDPGPILLLAGQSTEATYHVTLDLDDPPFVTGWSVQGTITIENPAPMDATLASVTDMVSPDIAATVDCPSLIVPSGGSLACTYGPVQLTDSSTRTNTATATLINNNGQTTGFDATAAIDFSQASLVEIDKEVQVSDSLKGPLGTVRYGVDPLPFTTTYTHTITGPEGTCGLVAVENEACFVTNDTATTGCDVAAVEAIILCEAAFGFEDLPIGSVNLDWDYNDWLATVELGPTFSSASAGGDLLSMDFSVQPEARGAAFDHAFSLTIPSDGFACDGTYTLSRFDGEGNLLFEESAPFDASIGNQFEVLPRTSEVFPASTNTDEALPYVPPERTASLSIVFDEPCPFEPRAFDPMPTVHGEGLFFSASLYVHNTGQTIGAGDARTLLVPVQWKWPEERIPVWVAYPLVQENIPPIFPWGWWLEYTDAVYEGKP